MRVCVLISFFLFVSAWKGTACGSGIGSPGLRCHPRVPTRNPRACRSSVTRSRWVHTFCFPGPYPRYLQYPISHNQSLISTLRVLVAFGMHSLRWFRIRLFFFLHHKSYNLMFSLFEDLLFSITHMCITCGFSLCECTSHNHAIIGFIRRSKQCREGG